MGMGRFVGDVMGMGLAWLFCIFLGEWKEIACWTIWEVGPIYIRIVVSGYCEYHALISMLTISYLCLPRVIVEGWVLSR